MSALEQEIIEKFYRLDKEAQARVRAQIVQEAESKPSKFDWNQWFAEIDALRETARDEHGNLPFVDAVTLLREIRNGEDDE